uniref:Protein KRI1 homolog n=1 Tax=Caenorhabditis tropicalis TaxID=1561998 RepID=A0A1I7TA63_9PELO
MNRKRMETAVWISIKAMLKNTIIGDVSRKCRKSNTNTATSTTTLPHQNPNQNGQKSTKRRSCRTLGALKSGDRECFADGKGFFNGIQEGNGVAKKKKEKGKKDEKMTIKDYERKLVIEKGGQIDESDEEAEIQKTHQKGYYEEQEEIRKSLSAAINFGDDDEDDILTERKKTSKEVEEEEADFYEWMKTADGKADKKKAKELKHLKKFWKDEEHLDESEKFLRDYLMNKDYQPGENEENPTYEDIVALEEDEKELDKNRQYEQKYNFRFEDPDQEFIKQYPRTVAESMRTEDSSRKEKRHEREERKKQEKEEKKRELAELKKMKRSEIEQKLGKLRKAAGVEIPLTLDELNADFDPKEFDKKMKSIFNDEYYGVEENVQEDEDEKPVFSDMEDSDYEDYDNLDVEELKKQDIEEEEESEESDEEEEEAPSKKPMKNGKFDMVAAAQKAMNKDRNDNRRKTKRNALKIALAKKKPLFNPKEKTFEEYFNEYYALDYEDIIGDTPTRFKYRDVEANDFGLSANEILEADERQLNAWASLKKVTAYRTSQEEFFDRKAYQRKAEDVQKKKKILSTDFGGKKSLKRKAEEEEMVMAGEDQEEEEEEEKKKKKKKRGKKKVKVAAVEPVEEEEKEPEPEPEAVEEVQKEEEAPEAEPAKKKARKRNKNKNNVIAEKFGAGMTDSRVKAYGLNPNRFKKGLLYGK